jgi:hypothetical protein
MESVIDTHQVLCHVKYILPDYVFLRYNKDLIIVNTTDIKCTRDQLVNNQLVKATPTEVVTSGEDNRIIRGTLDAIATDEEVFTYYMGDT